MLCMQWSSSCEGPGVGNRSVRRTRDGYEVRQRGDGAPKHPGERYETTDVLIAPLGGDPLAQE